MNTNIEQPQFKSVLFVVDTQNIFYSARALHGNRARIDFLKLKDLAIGGLDISFLRSVAIVADFKLADSVFMNFLRKFGYEIESFEESSHQTIAALLDLDGKNYDMVIVASGAGDLRVSYQPLKDLGICIKILSFADSLHRQVIDIADEITYLGTSVLIRPTVREEAKIEPVV